MGSGRGQNRRSNAASGTRAARRARYNQNTSLVRYDPKAWSQFVASIDLEEVSLRSYYLGDEVNHETYDYVTQDGATGNGEAKLLTELLADAVSVCAITIPPPCDVADFEFYWARDETLGRHSHLWLGMADHSVLSASLGEESERGIKFCNSLWLMDDSYTRSMMKELARELTILVEDKNYSLAHP